MSDQGLRCSHEETLGPWLPTEHTAKTLTTYLGKSCSLCLPRVPFVNSRQFMYLVISLLVLRAGYGICLYQFLIIAYLFYSDQTDHLSLRSVHNRFYWFCHAVAHIVFPNTYDHNGTLGFICLINCLVHFNIYVR